jgi:hypothetical protein
MALINNEKPFKYISRNGTSFSARRCDFVGGVSVTAKQFSGDVFPEKRMVQDVAEMIGYHAANIRPELNGFAGYDCIDFTLTFGP